MIVKGGVCTTGCDERELLSMSVHSAYYLRATGRFGVCVFSECLFLFKIFGFFESLLATSSTEQH